MTSLIGAAFAAGTFLFVISLALRGEAGGRIRRLAVFCFLLALGPSVACHVFTSMANQATPGDIAGLVLFLLIASPIAYGALRLRARLREGEPRHRLPPARRHRGVSLRDDQNP